MAEILRGIRYLYKLIENKYRTHKRINNNLLYVRLCKCAVNISNANAYSVYLIVIELEYISNKP